MLVQLRQLLWDCSRQVPSTLETLIRRRTRALARFSPDQNFCIAHENVRFSLLHKLIYYETIIKAEFDAHSPLQCIRKIIWHGICRR